MERIDTTLVFALRERLREATGTEIETVETHISWVLLTPELAYKLKKPVHLPFVDFSSAAAREHFCNEELRLNQRFAPSLYLGVVPVYGMLDAPRIGGDGAHERGAPIDHLVCMRRFPEAAVLRSQLRAPSFDPLLLDRFAQRLAASHASADRATPPSPFGDPEQIALAATRIVVQLCAQLGNPRLEPVRQWIDDKARELRMAWIARQQGGAVRECHGDLHTANIVSLDDELVAFDCIEFDPALRWIDVMSDAAFLTMDLKARDRRDLAYRFLDAWLQHSGDYEGLPVLAFYEVYRALVRGLASCLGPGHGAADGTVGGVDYMACAQELMRDTRAGARLMITHGFSGSGKSSIASQLLQFAGAVRIRSDVERKRLFGLDPLARSAGQGIDIYTPEATRRTFDRMRACARSALLAGYPVIVDAAFLRRDERRNFERLAAELGVPCSILDCRASNAVLRHRVARRSAHGNDASEADLQVLERQLAYHEPLDEGESARTIEVFTDGAVDIASIDSRWRDAAAKCV
ncbi:bifunctional aminoglycoside phosphotransferase/ATP-binding protein [Variovorax paradoxus]|uniref:bifunctional aminoglycoside phosphotransferase/ATP-binding protein n=1 Tax=Variovorax paradoxus TaxID=34073 RepID=UPI002780E44C|nr:bifunctional aminoglycoside phosphotransferase/ATP-binding protein [Variovorax paradoxus]MDP9927959.1 aminoglycoside phosphotransferase family enzyme/predicted kinase [Variovorax paradoxus]